jgi:hypothetical protein
MTPSGVLNNQLSMRNSNMQIKEMATLVFEVRIGLTENINEVFKTVVDASHQLICGSGLPEGKATGRPTILQKFCRQQLKYELFKWVGSHLGWWLKQNNVLQVASFQVLLPKPKSACRKER